MTVLLAIAAALLDAALGEPRRWHPLVGFGRWAQRLEHLLNLKSLEQASSDAQRRGTSRQNFALRLHGVLALALAVGPWALLVWALVALGGRYLGYAASIVALYFALGNQSLREHALSVHRALSQGDLAQARARVGFIVSRDTGQMDARAVAAAAVESVLENGNDAVFGALFWFLIAGAPGVLLYRLVNTLDAMWGYRTPRYLYFGWAAARLDDVLNFIPARLTALTYAVIGHTGSALRCWRQQAGAWESPNAGPVMAAGAGALEVALGGGAYYHGQWEERPPLGTGSPPDAASIPAALRLVRFGVVLWLTVLIIMEGVAHA